MDILRKIKTLSDWIHAADAVVAFTGAGISTPSGIPDFRSEESGLWTEHDPLEVASIYGFRRDPQAFYDWVRPLVVKTLNAQPNAAHKALADLERLEKLTTVVTQNIDMLHTRAGNQSIFELHGHMREATCIQCFHIYDNAPILEKFLADGNVPYCPRCGGVIKPNTILFGEQLPIVELQGAKKAIRQADILLVVGSSLEVAPANELPLFARRNGAKVVIINIDATMTHGGDLVINGDAAEILPAVVRALETAKSP